MDFSTIALIHATKSKFRNELQIWLIEAAPILSRSATTTTFLNHAIMYSYTVASWRVMYGLKW